MNFWEKLLHSLGLLEEEEEELPGPNVARRTSKKGKIVDFPTQETTYRLIVSNPASFAEVEEIGSHLKNKRTVVVNLEGMETAEAKRTIDFLSGVIFALNGSSQKINNNIFVFVPSGVTLNPLHHQGLSERDYLLRDTDKYPKD
ncbi:MAG: cell division protein SepF [Dethiobacter sp.]|jgi:cell division inhibitor SepF|nr:MAG: cell division protein SepF [Dethiobacter sp.]